MEIGNLLFGNSRDEYEVDRGLQDAFINSLERAGFDAYGYAQGWKSPFKAPKPYPDSATDTGRFVILPYQWDDEDAFDLPNFMDRQTGLEISWYKYPLRDSYSNKPIGARDILAIMEDLVEETHGLGAKPYDSDAETNDLNDTFALEMDACARIANGATFDDDVVARFARMVKTRPYRQPRSPVELAFAIDTFTGSDHRIWGRSIRDENDTPVLTFVEIEHKDANTFRVARRTVAQGSTTQETLFEGDFAAFFASPWYVLLANRITYDVPDLSAIDANVQVVDDDVTHIDQITLTDVRPYVGNTRIVGTANMTVDVDKANGLIAVTIEDANKDRRAATLTVEELMRVLTLGQLMHDGEAQLSIEPNNPYATVSLGSSRLETYDAIAWNDPDER